MLILINCNPADDASRGIDCFNIRKEHRWFQGPRFLWGPEEGWPAVSAVGSLSTDDPNLRVHNVVCTKLADANDVVVRILKMCSSWYRLKKNVAWILVVINQLRNKVKGLVTREYVAWSHCG